MSHQSTRRNAARLPIALTIAGSDSGGGAGIQADLKTFASLGVHGTTAITCLTAQNPRGVIGIEAASPRIVQAQLAVLFAELPPRAAKTGMLFSAEIIETVAEFFTKRSCRWLVVDPVMVATSGARLLKPRAITSLVSRLLPRASVVTPNLDEAELLVGSRLTSVEDLRQAARVLNTRFGCAALVKGGHLRGLSEAVDIFYDGRTELLLRAPFIRNVSTHGTGCTYSAAITAYLARGLPLPDAVFAAKQYITEAIANTRRIGPHTVLHHPSAPLRLKPGRNLP
jgi:hydroxymethylpyrimidine/phosphomethylpyrimidine kinase